MLSIRKSLATVAFSVVAFAGAANVGADEMGFLAFDILGHDEMNTFLRADLTPMMNGQPLMVRFGAEPYTGPYIGGTMARAGVNYFCVPNPHMPGWYTAECAGRKEPEQDISGLN